MSCAVFDDVDRERKRTIERENEKESERKTRMMEAERNYRKNEVIYKRKKEKTGRKRIRKSNIKRDVYKKD